MLSMFSKRSNKRNVRKIPKQHYIYLLLLLLSFLSSLTLHRAGLIRSVQSVRDLFTSIAIWFLSLFDIENLVPATIQTYDFPDIAMYIGFDVDEILLKLSQLFPSLFTKEYFFGYLLKLVSDFKRWGYALLILVPLVLISMLLVNLIYLRPHRNGGNRIPLVTNCVQRFRRFLYHLPPPKVIVEDTFTPFRGRSKPLVWFQDTILPKLQVVGKRLREFWKFGKGFWRTSLILIWLVNFNVLTIAVSALAAYFYILGTFNLAALFFQLVKLLIDLLVMFSGAPLFFWIIVSYVALDYIRKYIGDLRLYGHEAANQEFIEELPLSSLVTGWMAAGKTALITDMGLSYEAIMRDKALDFIYEINLKFPDFPWRKVEQAVDYGMRFGAIPSEVDYECFPGLRNLVTVRDYFNALRSYYNGNPSPDNCFGYDAQNEKAYADNGLTVTNIFDAIVDYAQLYYIYQIDSSLLVSSYAVRGGVRRSDNGHFPMFEVDFFDRKSFARVGVGDRMSHIIDYDMFRMGKKVDHRNPNIGLYEFGCCLMSEKGKERGNMLENQGLKKDDINANPKNDYFDKDLKMRRHAATVYFYCFCKFFSDEQRPESVGANEREVSQIIHMDGVEKEGVFCPFFTLTGAFSDWIRSSFKKFFYSYRKVRDDDCLLVYSLRHFVSWIVSYVEKQRNVYGYKLMRLRLEDGTGGEARDRFYCISKQKLYSGRYSTDCLKGIYVDQIRNCQKSLADLETYRGIVAEPDELRQQHSYFIADVFKENHHENRGIDQ